MNSQHLESLLHRYFDQLLEPAERAELESILLEDPAAREQFWEMARCHALVRYWGEMEVGCREAADLAAQPEEQPRSIVRQRRESIANKMRRLWRWWIPIPAVAFGVIVLMAGLQFARHEFSSVAKVTRVYQAQWVAGSGRLSPGQTLNRRWLRLAAGAVEIEFSSGARVVLQGPAELKIVSRNEAFLRGGKLNAVVPPPAHGFKVGTPDFSVVDHGTKFGCLVGTGGLAEVHVFAGVVSWEPHSREYSTSELTANQALKISHSQVQSIPANPSLFLSEDNLMLDAWREKSRWLRGNPDGLVYFDFENTNKALLVPNLAQSANANSDAKVTGCKFVSGRFSGKTGVEFKNVKDRLRLTVPGQYDALTFLAWVRIDSLPPDQASLAMTESFTVGEVHWFVHYDGSFGLGVHAKLSNNMNGWQFVESPAGIISTNLGSWIMLASTFDRTTGMMTDYLNGKPVATGKIITAHAPLRLDTFEIGNWGVPANDPRVTIRPRRGHPGDAVRNLDGCMDEFAVLATVLRPEDFQRLYDEGRPSQSRTDE